MKTLLFVRLLTLLLGLLALAKTAWADCSGPTGTSGDMTYNTTYNVMAFCNGTNWISMAGATSVGVSDPRIGTINAGGWCKGNGGGNGLDCTASAPGVSPSGVTGDVQFNSSGTLAADTGNFTYASGLLKAPNISTTAITASGAGSFGTINSTGLGTLGSLIVTGGATVTGQASITTISTSLIQIGNNGAACTAGLAGAQRYNSVSNTMDYCTGSAWMSLGPSATSPVAFLVTRNGVDQSITTSVYTKVDWTTKVFDTNSNFDLSTDRFTPTIPGYYVLSLKLALGNGSPALTYGYISKNGTSIANSLDTYTNGSHSVTVIAYANGSTDYFEASTYQSTGSTVALTGIAAFSYFTGSILGPQSGGGGGAANPAGSTNDVQFNSSGLLAADTGNFTYTTATGTLSATTVSTTRINMAPSVSTVVSLNGGSGNMISSGSAVVSTSSAGSIGMFVGGSQRMIIGTTYFGFGTTAPSTTIDVNGLFNINPLAGYYTDLSNNVAYYSGAWRSKTGGPGTVISLRGGNQAGYTGDIVFFTTPEATSTAAGASLAMPERMRIDSNGRVGIGVSTPSDTLDIGNGIFRGNIRSRTGLGTIGSNAINFYWSGSAAQLWVDGANIGNITVSSDRRVKTDITPLQEDRGLAVIEKMKPVSFHWKNKESGTNLQYGFIAQDMMKVLPDIVSNTGLKTEYTPDGLLRIDYNGLIAPMVKSIQELKADNDNLRDDIRRLEGEINALKRKR